MAKNYGSTLTTDGVRGLLEHVIEANTEEEARGERGTPVCIWGPHGNGKTTLVRDFAAEKGMRFVYVAPAQFEEMGDLHGLPVQRGKNTVFAAPEWVPTEEGPGIIVFDDFNRAEDRIIRGLMQLLQNGGMFSWKLPKNWHIVLTANPEGAGYSVTPIDEAVATRMLHVRLDFDIRCWADWAKKAGVDRRGVNFLVKHHEHVGKGRNTPRSFVQFFSQIRNIQDLKAKEGLVVSLGSSALESSTVVDFLSYVEKEESIPEPTVVVNAKTQKAARIAGRILREDRSGISMFQVFCDRLRDHLAKFTELSDAQLKNMVSFMTDPDFPQDLLHPFNFELMKTRNQVLKPLWRHVKIAEILAEHFKEAERDRT